ncbi:antitermination protein [Pantoea sp. BAV 3049]|uniref:antitermination protein n=1 Tax=Pantoea sp. BAV 3049 TaxID=2654188 RepID=UPI001E3CB740|nr:antitermination protein [Pantoea sp. BAV 3049]
MSAFLAKTGVSNGDRYRTIEQLLSYANRTAPKLVIRAADGKLGKCLVVLSKLAFEEYSRSAATTSACQHCNGKGQITARCRCNGTGRVCDLAESAR